MTNRINNQNEKKIRFSWSNVLNHKRTVVAMDLFRRFHFFVFSLLFELNVKEEGRADALFFLLSFLVVLLLLARRVPLYPPLLLTWLLLPDELPIAFSSSSSTKSRQLQRERERKTPVVAAAGPRL